MSSAPAFKTVVFFDQDEVLVFVTAKKGWRQLAGTHSLSQLPDKEIIDAVKDGNVLAVVSDEACGHLQLIVPNKKEAYADENIGRLLGEQHIDINVYEFASQRFPLGRDEIQVSVSGIEKEVYQKVERWVSALGSKKFWLLPFGWFVSALKSVEPALIAVILNPKRVLVSHHYLGVDDARVIPLADLRDYVLARKEERKETHLLYLQGAPDLRRETTKQMGEAMAVHTLLPDEGENALLAVVEAVMAKGGETLSELLHFVGEAESAEKATKTAKAEVVKTEVVQEELAPEVAAATSVSVAEELPKPELPTSVENVEPVAPSESAARTVVEVEEEPPVVVAPAVEVPVVTELPAASEAPTDLVSQLHEGPVVKDNTDRYLEMPEKRSRWKGPILVFLAVTIITGVVGGAVFWSRQVRPPGPPLLPAAGQSTPTPEPTPTATPTASPAAELSAAEKKQTSIVVLNATGVAGLAGKVKTKLAESGWTNVRTGNAEGSYDGATFIYTAKEELIPILSKDLGVELKRAAQVKESSAADATVVIILAERLSL